jgi:methionine synthase II (cobalamin-independent)
MIQHNGGPPFRAEHVGSFPRPDRLLAVTDREYPKKSWHEFLFEKCDGFDSERPVPDFKFRLFDGTQFEYPGEPRVIAKLRRRERLSAENFSFLK